jgi:hypothetical protein
MAIQTKQTVIRPLDVVILLKKMTPSGCNMNGKQLAESLGISAAEVSIAMERNRIAGLTDDRKYRINVLAVRDFLIYGLKYCFPAQPGPLVRGIPTASSAAPINTTVVSNGEKFVWADPEGTERGQSIIPLYANAIFASKLDADFYALLAIVDTFRIGKAREIQAAKEELETVINRYVSLKQ